jgi:hypothetical protein
LVITVYGTNRDPHAADAMISVIETSGEVYVYEADLYSAGFGFTVAVGGPPALFNALRDIGVIDANCTTTLPTKIIPAHGFVQTIEESIAELVSLGVDVGC